MPVQTRASSRRAAERALARPTLPLLQLPGPAQQALVAHLSISDRRSLRLACKATMAMVNPCLRALALQHCTLARTAQLLQQFPAVTELEVEGPLGSDSGNSPAGQQHSSSMAMKPWDSISTLTLNDCPIDEAALVLAACPGVESCCIYRANGVPGGSDMPALCRTLAGLPTLTTLDLFDSAQQLGDAELSALSGCHSLIMLKAHLGDGLSGKGWAALMGMTSLTNLYLEHGSLPRDLRLDLRPLSVLIELEFMAYRKAEAPHYAVARGTLQLPGSLNSVAVDILPMAALASMSQLTYLQFDKPERVSAAELAAIAAACPVLASLTIMDLCLTPECHNTPLLALTELACIGSVEAAPTSSLSGVCPGLRALSLECDAGMPSDDARAALLHAANTLETFEIVESGRWDGVSSCCLLQLQDFAALASLPRLDKVCLPATPDHVQGLGQLSNLHNVDWLFATQALHKVETISQVETSFATSNAPALLNSASLDFTHEDSDYESDVVHAVTGLILAVIKWLVRAPALTQVLWKAHVSGPAALTPARLRLLARSNIKRITIEPLESVDACAWHSDMLPAVHVLAASGIEVVLKERPNHF